MNKTFKFRIYPNKHQQRVLQNQLDECRRLYNHFLAERRKAWEELGEGVTFADQCATLPQLKQEWVSLKQVYSQVLQDVAARVDKAFRHFFRRIQAGEKPGYPRFKGYNRYDSFTYKQAGFGWKIKGNSLELSKIGGIRMKRHRK